MSGTPCIKKGTVTPKGNNLKALRVKAGLSQREASEKLGVSQFALNSWERGAHHPRRNNLVKMMSVYGILFDGVQPVYTDMKDKQSHKKNVLSRKVCILNRVRHLSDEALIKLGDKVYSEFVKRGLVHE